MNLHPTRPATLALTLTLAGCGAGSSELVAIDGSSTMFPLGRAAQTSHYRSGGEGVCVVVDRHGTGGGFARYARGEVDLVSASRPPLDSESRSVAAAGRPWDAFVVGHDGVTVVVHPSNPVSRSLAPATLGRLLDPRGGIATWGDLDPGIDPGWASRPIHCYFPDEDSGTRQYLGKLLLGAPDAPQRPDAEANSDDYALVRGVASDPEGFGYFGFGYYRKSRPGALRALAIDGIEPSEETIRSKSYPLARQLTLHVWRGSRDRPGSSGFVGHWLAHAGEIAEAGGVVGPTEEERRGWPSGWIGDDPR